MKLSRKGKLSVFVDTKRCPAQLSNARQQEVYFCLGHMCILPVNVSLHLTTDGVKDVVFLCCCISINW